jgi:hypothetical protein
VLTAKKRRFALISCTFCRFFAGVMRFSVIDCEKNPYGQIPHSAAFSAFGYK